MIEVRNLNKSFDGQQVLSAVCGSFEEGQTNLVIGRSGSGKTVLLRCLIGLLKPEDGNILYDGRDFFSLDSKALQLLRQEMGVVFQGAALFDTMNVLENVMFPLTFFSKEPVATQKAMAQECLERVGMLDAMKKMPAELSGGMQKRVAIARAIVLRPKYLFCDEPTSGLDPVTAQLIDELIHSLTVDFGMTTVINTHDMHSVLGIGENILFIHEGKAAWQGTKENVLHSGNTLLETFMKPALML